MFTFIEHSSRFKLSVGITVNEEYHQYNQNQGAAWNEEEKKVEFGDMKNIMDVYQEIERKQQLGYDVKMARIGDRVELARQRMGTIRYIGHVKFYSSDDVLGIELDKFDAQAHDGRGYFETKKGHGYAIFKRMNEIKRLIPMDKLITPVSISRLQRSGSGMDISGGFRREDVTNIAVDDRVRLRNGRTGVIRFALHYSSLYIYGLETN